MVKLIRITSEDNGNFNAELSDGIPIKPNATIALQNLTAETVFETITINSSNEKITSNQRVGKFTDIKSNLALKTYTSANHNDFLIDLEATLNETLEVTNNGGIRYLDLPTGNVWTQSPGGNTENFDTSDLGDIATYRRVSSGGTIRWWEATGPTSWNRYFTKPIAGSNPDGTATANLVSGELDLGGGVTFTPAQMPTLSPVVYDETGDVYRAIRIDYPGRTPTSGDNVKLEMRYTPLTFPLFTNDLEGRFDDQELFYVTDTIDVNKSKDLLGSNIGNIQLADGVAATAERKHILTTRSDDVFLARGCGVWGCRIQNLINNAGGQTLNGFGIGLSFTRPLLDSDRSFDKEIPNNTRDFEISIDESNDFYAYITPTVPNTIQNTSLPPWSYLSPTPADGGLTNDHFIFIRNGRNITLQIWNIDGTGPTGDKGQIAFSETYTLTRAEMSKPLYPYLYINGSAGADPASSTIIGRPFFTADPFMDGNDEYKITGSVQATAEMSVGATPLNIFETLLAVYPHVIPVLGNAAFIIQDNSPPYRWNMSNEVWNHLGFAQLSNSGYYSYNPIPTIYTYDENFGRNGPNEQRLRIVLNSTDDYALVNSDNYVVVLDSNPVLSYDASEFSYGNSSGNVTNYNQMKGRRLNILATIPVNNTDGILEFESKQLVFIDFDNKYPQEIKNLRLRLLNKSLEPVTTNGRSVMTLLIKDKE
tara:strand:- start:638 stop:2755 length:2118 start_codon:yes stop_codon:yes gene_type:complete